MKRTRAALSATVIAFLATAVPTAGAIAGSPATGFTGHWESIDCATSEIGEVDCSVAGDGSTMTLVIGPGQAPHAVLRDSYATVCAENGSANTRWVAAGTGEYEDIFLWLTFSKSGCGTFGMGGYGGVQLYHDPGSDTIWSDPDGDGWGNMWFRTP
jgi:hypothetical protein